MSHPGLRRPRASTYGDPLSNVQRWPRCAKGASQRTVAVKPHTGSQAAHRQASNRLSPEAPMIAIVAIVFAFPLGFSSDTG